MAEVARGSAKIIQRTLELFGGPCKLNKAPLPPPPYTGCETRRLRPNSRGTWLHCRRPFFSDITDMRQHLPPEQFDRFHQLVGMVRAGRLAWKVHGVGA